MQAKSSLISMVSTWIGDESCQCLIAVVGIKHQLTNVLEGIGHYQKSTYIISVRDMPPVIIRNVSGNCSDKMNADSGTTFFGIYLILPFNPILI